MWKGSEKMSQARPKILVIFYSLYGHVYKMAEGVVEGIREAGGEPILKQVAEHIPETFWNEYMRKIKALIKTIPVADPDKDLIGIDGVIVGTPTRFAICARRCEAFGIRQEVLGRKVLS